VVPSLTILFPGVLRFPRRILAALVLGMYLLAGVAHGVCDLDVVNPSGKMAISLSDKSIDQSEKGSASGHHCHGCFSVSLPAFGAAALVVEPVRKVSVAHLLLRRGLPPGIDPPPPKTLI